MNFQTFKTEILNIHPEGDIVHAYEQVNNYISIGTTVDQQPLSHEIVIKKFRDYVLSWNNKYSKKQASGYLSKANELKPIDGFVNDGMYQHSYQTTITNIERDKYLFGDDFEDLYNKMKDAERQIKEAKERLDQ